MKTCSKCGVEKPLTEFSERGGKRVGKRESCKDCCGLAHAAYHIKNREQRCQRGKTWYAKNRIRRLAQQKKYNATRGSQTEYQRSWRDANREIVRKRDAEYQQHRRKTDPAYKLLSRYRIRIYCALKGNRKSDRTLALLGCSIKFLCAHLEKQFVPGMTWENYGPVWHVDHILPCAEFHLQHSEEQEICFHWTNLQPLFALDNLLKSDKII